MLLKTRIEILYSPVLLLHFTGLKIKQFMNLVNQIDLINKNCNK